MTFSISLKARTATTVCALFMSAWVQAELIVSHKTAGLEYPENSIEGFRASLAMPVNAIELDIHVTKDKQLILHHDPVLSSYNCFGKDSKERLIIAQSTLKELVSIDCQNHKVDAPYHLPSLDTVLQVYAESDRSKDLYLEIKVWDELIENNPLHKGLDISMMHYPDDEVAGLVLDAVRKYDLNQNIVFNTFSRELLLTLRNKQRDDEVFRYGLLYKGDYAPWTLGIIALFTPLQCYDSCWAPDYREVRRWLNQNQIDYLLPNFAQLTNFLFRRGYTRHIEDKENSFEVIPWTLNTPEQWITYRDYNFAGIITDTPSAYEKQ